MVRKKDEHYEERVKQAVTRVKAGTLSTRKASEIYDVCRGTLMRRINGLKCKADIRASGHRLNTSGERVLIEHIRSLDRSGFPPSLEAVNDAASHFSMIPGKVGKRWASRFVDRRPELKKRLTRAHDYQRTFCEDPVKVKEWFDHYLDMKSKYEIHDGDVYNMDETGFQLGIINSSLGVVCSERKGRGIKVQPGNREWATAIVCIGIGGYPVPPLLILSGKSQRENWHNKNTPDGWMFAATESGWTDNEKALRWLKEFDRCTVKQANGRYRMLILDGHRSHLTVPFREYCQDNKIILVCLPAHSSHILQPLDVGLFSPLKRNYRRELDRLIQCHIMDISKAEFITCFRDAYLNTVTESNVAGAFRETGLMPYSPDKVLSKLNENSEPIVTPPSSPQSLDWQPVTPHRTLEALAHTRHILQDINEGLVEGFTSERVEALFSDVRRIHKFIVTGDQENSLSQMQISRLKMANQAKVRRLGGRRVAGGDVVHQSEIRAESERLTAEAERRGGQKVTRTCGICKKPGHNARTCNGPASNDGEGEEAEVDASEMAPVQDEALVNNVSEEEDAEDDAGDVSSVQDEALDNEGSEEEDAEDDASDVSSMQDDTLVNDDLDEDGPWEREASVRRCKICKKTGHNARKCQGSIDANSVEKEASVQDVSIVPHDTGAIAT